MITTDRQRRPAVVGLLLFGGALLAARPMRAQPTVAERAVGRLVIERVFAPGDSTHSSAVLLPTGYGAHRRWPVLFVLDPRGRAMPTLERFADAADRLGYVIVSSYDSRSDSSSDVNVGALDAMLSTAQSRFSIDTTRMYLAGFSGTARQIWDFAAELRANVAGVIGFGAGLPNLGDGFARAFGGDRSFAYYGGAGDEDFNYVETHLLAAQLHARKMVVHVAEYAGPHGWPPAAICGDALEWMHVRAMLAGRIAMDSALVTRRMSTELDSARALERRGLLAEATMAFRDVAEEYLGWPAVREATERVATLEQDRSVREHIARSEGLQQADQRQEMEMQRVLLLARGHSPNADQLLDQLKVGELRRQVETGDSLAAPAARRLLARVQVALAFYEPHGLLARGAPRDALVMLAAASRIAPLAGESCTMLARAHALAPDVHPELRCLPPPGVESRAAP
jgi:predicted esterase